MFIKLIFANIAKNNVLRIWLKKNILKTTIFFVFYFVVINFCRIFVAQKQTLKVYNHDNDDLQRTDEYYIYSRGVH